MVVEIIMVLKSSFDMNTSSAFIPGDDSKILFPMVIILEMLQRVVILDPG